MARKVSKGKKPTETMRQRQRRLLKEQQARKAAKTKPVRSPGGSAVSQRVKPVKVKVEPQKSLPPSKTQRALPPGQRGGAVSTDNKPRRRNVNTNSSGGNRTGQPGQRGGAITRRSSSAITRTRNPGGNGGLLGPLALGSSIGAWMNETQPRRPTPNGRGSGRATDRVKPGPSNRTARQQSSNTTAAANARIKKQREERAAALARTKGGNNSAILRPAPAGSSRSTPTPDRKPTPTRKPTPARSGAASTRSGAGSTPSKAPQSKTMDANYRAWAKANPSLAKKVKKGQAGYNAINNKPSSKPSVPANRGAGNGAPGAQIRKTEPAAPKQPKSALEIAAERRKKKKSAANRAGWQGNRNY